MKKTSYLLAALFFGLWAASSPARNRDLSKPLNQLLEQGISETRLVAALRPYHVIFVSGFLSNVQIRPRWIGNKFFHSGEHFNDQIAWLTRNGIANQRIDLNSEAIPLQNGGELALRLRPIQKPILLITHSKGGLDVLHMLVNWPSIRPKIAGWVAIQAPFHGTPVANFVAGHRFTRDISYPLLDLVGGSHETVGQLSTATTEAYLAANAPTIAAILDRIPVVCFGSHKPNIKGRDMPLQFAVLRHWMLRHGIRNDGLVPERSAILPGADFALIDGIHHAAPVADEGGFRFSRVPFTQALVSLLMTANGL